MIVSGAPASGKTTLARLLANELGLPCLHRDVIREAMADALPMRGYEETRPLAPAAFVVFYRVIEEMLASGASLVIEANFHTGLSEAELRPLTASARSALVHCQVPQELSLGRFEQRLARGERHWSYYDAETLARMRAGEPYHAWAAAEDPVDVDIPKLRVDTTDGYQPSVPEILAFIDQAVRLTRTETGTSPNASELLQ